ncbi:S8 family serine peptidase [Actinoallomurus sp. NPDC050550]|uniref:S8 family serine peptidase n=1 Tax=Actinoallomurus sp. NPDC050550 TaxID=3154937 RepID=UPI0033DF3281
MRRAFAMAGAVTVTFTATPVAGATPQPRNEEWWFSTWDIQKKVWPLTTGRGITVAVLDTGVNAKLPDLADVVLPGTDLTGRKDDGRIDFDAAGGGHGTGMTALIAGQGPTMVGVAPGAKILPITISREHANYSSTDAQAKGIRYAVDHGAKVISMSTGGISPDGPLRCDYYLQGAVDYAIKHDVVLVAAAGNDGDTTNAPASPTACPGVVGVGAVDYQARPWVQTARQPYVVVAAPGVDTGSMGRAGVFSNSSGTSGSTALTAGAVALVRAKFPQMSGQQVVQRIIASALDTGPRGVDLQTGYGLLRPYHALIDRVAADAPNPVYDRWDKAQRQSGMTTTPSTKPSSIQSVVAKPHRKSGGSSFIRYTVAGLVILSLVAGVGVVVFRHRREVLS